MASHAQCIPFPISGDKTLMKGMPRNYELYDPFDFLAEVTQQIPNKGEHQVRYYGFYSNKTQGILQKKKPTPATEPGSLEPDTSYRRKCRYDMGSTNKVADLTEFDRSISINLTDQSQLI